MIVLALIALAVLVRIPILLEAANLINLDEASMALMAKRILEGELALYLSGHSYIGAFASYIMAPFIAAFGTTAFPIKLAALTFFLTFFVLQYKVLEKIAGQRVAVFASLFLIVMPPDVLDLEMKLIGGHLEMLVFQAGLFLLLYRYFEEPTGSNSVRVLFGIGLLAGAALWIYELTLVFLIPYLLFFLLRFREPKEESLAEWIRNLFLLRLFNLPRWLRGILLTWHVGVAMLLVLHTLSVFFLKTPWFPVDWTEKFFDFFGAVPPFQIKTMKKLFFAFAVEFLLVGCVHHAGSLRTPFLRKIVSLGGGLILGHFPALLFILGGGEGLRIFHNAGFIGLAEIAARIRFIFTKALPEFILGLGDPRWIPHDSTQIQGTLVFLGVILLACGLTAVYFWKDLKELVQAKSRTKGAYVWVFYFIAGLTLFVNLGSTLEAARYLAPLHIALAAILGYFLGEIVWPRWRSLAGVLTVLILFHLGLGTYRFYRAIPKDLAPGYQQILNFLESQKIYGGFAARTVSHLLTYLSGEKIVFSTYKQQERYLPYERFAQTLKRPAYVFESDDSSAQAFRNDSALFRQLTQERAFGPFVVYLIEEPWGSPDRPYTAPRPKFPVHLYLNE